MHAFDKQTNPLPETLKRFLRSDDAVWVGRNIIFDRNWLEDDFGIRLKRMVDVAKESCLRGLVPNARASLQNVVKIVLNQYLPKTQLHDAWDMALTDKMAKYAALDAYLPVKIMEELKKIPRTGDQYNPSEDPIGTALSIAYDAETILAHGELVQHADASSNRLELPDGTGATITLKGRALVKVTRVLCEDISIKGWGISRSDIPESGQRLSYFGEPPFLLVVPVKYLRVRAEIAYISARDQMETDTALSSSRLDEQPEPVDLEAFQQEAEDLALAAENLDESQLVDLFDEEEEVDQGLLGLLALAESARIEAQPLMNLDPSDGQPSPFEHEPQLTSFKFQRGSRKIFSIG